MRKTGLYIVSLLLLISMAIAGMESCKNTVSENTEAVGKVFQFREKLSDYGFFKNKLSDLDPNANVVHYELSTPLFTDYAVKDRFFVLPAGKQSRNCRGSAALYCRRKNACRRAGWFRRW